MLPQHDIDKTVVINQAIASLNRKPIFLDTETTGLDPDDEIIEISIVDSDGKVLLDTLVKPTSKLIPQEATNVHHISNEMVASLPTIATYADQIIDLMTNNLVAAYNADFDVRMILQSLHVAGKPILLSDIESYCIMKAYAVFYGDWNPTRQSYAWQRLENAAKQQAIQMPNSHRALDDTLLARALFLHMVQSDSEL